MGTDEAARLKELFQEDQQPAPPDPPVDEPDDEDGDRGPGDGDMPYVQCGDCDFYVQGWNEVNNRLTFRAHPCAMEEVMETGYGALGGIILLILVFVVGAAMGPVFWDWFVSL